MTCKCVHAGPISPGPNTPDCLEGKLPLIHIDFIRSDHDKCFQTHFWTQKQTANFIKTWWLRWRACGYVTLADNWHSEWPPFRMPSWLNRPGVHDTNWLGDINVQILIWSELTTFLFKPYQTVTDTSINVHFIKRNETVIPSGSDTVPNEKNNKSSLRCICYNASVVNKSKSKNDLQFWIYNTSSFSKSAFMLFEMLEMADFVSFKTKNFLELEQPAA